MRILLFPGCKVPYYAPYNEVASRLILKEFNVEIEPLELNCCGYPIRFLDFKAFLFSSARNLSLAGRKGFPLVCLCKCCYGTLRYADLLLREHRELREEINGMLQQEGLRYVEGVEIKHFLNILYEDIGLEAIQKKVTNPFQTLKVAAHYGCHILRPHDVVQFDDPVKPTKFEKLIAVTGAKPVDWSLRLQCCGEPLWDKNQEVSVRLTGNKMVNAKQAGADYLCAACTHCQIQFERARKDFTIRDRAGETLPSLLYPQMLGLCLGLEPSDLGIDEEHQPHFNALLNP
ncbi:MAG: CoB--CoM heterodisulfide reductase iron-sulfur subunit B family protein [Deltaproteobacteria bacterium]|nr:CoB--CoM heterodisulfide reductase iron-sulfur subunit B family protein [Deltaproteobacteria bacterium]